MLSSRATKTMFFLFHMESKALLSNYELTLGVVEIVCRDFEIEL